MRLSIYKPGTMVRVIDNPVLEARVTGITIYGPECTVEYELSWWESNEDTGHDRCQMRVFSNEVEPVDETEPKQLELT